MKKLILVLLLVVGSSIAYGQRVNRSHKRGMIEVTDIISLKEFLKIRRYVVDNGTVQVFFTEFKDTPCVHFSEVDVFVTPMIKVVDAKTERLAVEKMLNRIIIRNSLHYENEKAFPYPYIDLIPNMATKKVYIDVPEEEIINRWREVLPKYLAPVRKAIK